MTKERAIEIATNHVTNCKEGEISFFALGNGRNLHIQTLFEPGYYDDSAYVCYIDIEDDEGDCIETHTTHQNDINGIAFWISEMCNEWKGEY